jgi:sugar lactone lactonase YvrE
MMLRSHIGLRRRARSRIVGVALTAVTMGATTVFVGAAPASAGTSAPGLATLVPAETFAAYSVATDPSGDVLVAGAFVTSGGPGPYGIALLTPGGPVPIVGFGTNVITITPQPAMDTQFDVPSGMVFDATTGNFFFADAEQGEVFEYSPANDTIWLVAGGGTGTPSTTTAPGVSVRLSSPWGLAVDNSGDLFIADGVDPSGSGNKEIDELSPSGNLAVIAGGGSNAPSTTPQPATSVKLAEPFGLALDNAGNLYVADAPDYVTKIDLSTGELAVVAGGGTNKVSTTPQPATSIHLDGISGLAIGPSGTLYVAGDHLRNGQSSRLMQLSGGDLSIVAGGGTGTPPISGTVDPTSVHLGPLGGVAVDSAGRIYLVDISDNAVFGIGTAPTVSAVSPTAGSATKSQTVTITGSDLALATAVHFGSVAATIKSCSVTSCVVTIPADNSGTVPVTVTTPFGTSLAGSGTDYTYDVATTTSLSVSATAVHFGEGHGVTLKVTVTSASGTPTGSVTVAGTPCSMRLSGGSASCVIGAKALAIGGHDLVAKYSGASGYASSSSKGVTVKVLKATTTTTLRATKSALVYGKENAGHFVISVHSPAGAVKGTVTLSGGGLSCTKSVQGGTANCVLGPKTLPVGAYTITASFTGSADFAPSVSEKVTVRVTKPPKTRHKVKKHQTHK